MSKNTILILIDNDICYGINNHFAKSMGRALSELGEEVSYFEVHKASTEDLIELAHTDYKAILGFQSPLFSAKFSDGRLLFADSRTPLFTMVLDHPCVMHKHWLNSPKGLTVLSHDRNYKAFIEKYYGDTLQCMILPPAGEEALIPSSTSDAKQNPDVALISLGNQNPAAALTSLGQETSAWLSRPYDLSFIGTYTSYEAQLNEAHQVDSWSNGFASALIDEMLDNLNDTYNDVFERTADRLLPGLSNTEKRELYHACRCTYYVVCDLLRQKIFFTLLDSGLTLHVYGDSFRIPELAKYNNLMIHPELTPDQIPAEMSKAKISLNLMSWHKDGMTERIANALLNGCLCISDFTTYLDENFEVLDAGLLSNRDVKLSSFIDLDKNNAFELVLFDLYKYEELPLVIQNLLNNPEFAFQIATNGKEKALCSHTWKQRAQHFLFLL